MHVCCRPTNYKLQWCLVKRANGLDLFPNIVKTKQNKKIWLCQIWSNFMKRVMFFFNINHDKLYKFKRKILYHMWYIYINVIVTYHKSLLCWFLVIYWFLWKFDGFFFFFFFFYKITYSKVVSTQSGISYLWPVISYVGNSIGYKVAVGTGVGYNSIGATIYIRRRADISAGVKLLPVTKITCELYSCAIGHNCDLLRVQWLLYAVVGLMHGKQAQHSACFEYTSKAA